MVAMVARSLSRLNNIGSHSFTVVFLWRNTVNSKKIQRKCGSQGQYRASVGAYMICSRRLARQNSMPKLKACALSVSSCNMAKSGISAMPCHAMPCHAMPCRPRVTPYSPNRHTTRTTWVLTAEDLLLQNRHGASTGKTVRSFDGQLTGGKFRVIGAWQMPVLQGRGLHLCHAPITRAQLAPSTGNYCVVTTVSMSKARAPLLGVRLPQRLLTARTCYGRFMLRACGL